MTGKIENKRNSTMGVCIKLEREKAGLTHLANNGGQL